MSFSGDVRRELVEVLPGAKHCRIAELSAILGLCGEITIDTRGRIQIRILTENLTVARKYFILIKKVFHYVPETAIRRKKGQKKGGQYLAAVRDPFVAKDILTSCGMLRESDDFPGEDLLRGQDGLLRRDCCKRAYLRGTFLAAGMITNPEKAYQFEILTNDEERAERIRALIATFGVRAKVMSRGKNYVVYVKEGEQIVDLLNVMGAHVALMNFENVRILKEMRNQVNRGVNCETANIKKTVNAARRQVEDIAYIQETAGLSSLPDNLEQIARLRLEEPDISLAELGEMLQPPISKSGVNHRLRKISLLAAQLRQEKGEKT
ncbi:MAG: DNA-binding protein WhiA [Lachnospiraceae bacterium]|nr:DNA-binding protein WhiA [Lachnospiraceae bacterium]MBQ9562841.1 DNA-binding protein WhiA [Lachnospiraceae bacterium]MBQ9592998.1 DNA-binding protein WhiA [Lachnospiraceae bacterium]